MKTLLRSCFVLFGLLTLLTGVAYPLLVTVIGQALFPYQARGSVLLQDGQAVGSELIGQSFEAEGYFWSRPSATTPFANHAAASSGSNLGPTNPARLAAVKQRVEKLRKAHPDQASLVPVDLVTASASGLDPHLSPAAVEYQLRRVAQQRGLTETELRTIVARHTHGRQFSVLGEPRVNVLMLNRELDKK